jgi:predicted nucleic acid-binding protein
LRGFLLDTDVISMLSPSGGIASERFLAWLERMDGEGVVFLPVVTIHEIEKGIVLLERKGATAKATGLRAWLSGLAAAYDDKILSLDPYAATLAGRLEAKAISEGHDPGMADAMIAGIATAHELVVVTRNTRHFALFGIDVSSPDEIAERD